MGKKKVEKKMKSFHTLRQTENKVYWRAYHHVTNLFFLYILSKYKSNCSIVVDTQNFFHNGIVFDDTLQNDKKDGTEELIERICTCINNKNDEHNLIVIPFMLYLTSKRKACEIHMNVIIYRKNTRQFEHFEPHGAQFTDHSKLLLQAVDGLNRRIRIYLTFIKNQVNIKIPDLKSTLLLSYELCPDIQGLQSKECIASQTTPEGYCAAWSFFFIEMVLSNPNHSSKKIHELIMDEADSRQESCNEFLRHLIEGYAIHVDAKLKKYFSIIFGFDATLNNLESIDFMYTKACLEYILSIEAIRREKPGKEGIVQSQIKYYTDKIDDHLKSYSLDPEVYKEKMVGFLKRLGENPLKISSPAESPDTESPDSEYSLSSGNTSFSSKTQSSKTQSSKSQSSKSSRDSDNSKTKKRRKLF